MGSSARCRRVVFALALVAGGVVLSGCPRWAGSSQEPGAEAATRPASPAAASNPPPTYRLIVSLRVLQILVPKGSLERSGEFWGLLDQGAVGLRQRDVLDRNGFRVGLGRPEMLDRVNEALTEHKALSLPELTVSMVSGSPATITTAEHAQGQTIFLALANGTVSGLTFPPSTNLLRVACRIEPPKLTEVVFDVVPEIRFRARRYRLESALRGISRLPPHDSRLLMPLRFQLRAGKGHFFVLGPNGRADHPLLAAHRFLRRVEDRKEHDLLLIFVFDVVRRVEERPF